MKTIIKECHLCKTEFNAPLSEDKRGNARFCSLTCANRHNAFKRSPLPNFKCAYCNQDLHRSLSKQKQSKSNLFFCSRDCKDKAQRLGGIEAIQPDHYGNRSSTYRNFALRSLPNKCNRCPYDTLEALIVHHKDKDRSNNDLNNLEILCANCHMIEHSSN